MTWLLRVVWKVVIRRPTSLWLPEWRVPQLVKHGLNEALQQRHQSVSGAQAARWGYMDEGRSPLTVIERAVICKVTKVPVEEDGEHYLTLLSVCQHIGRADVCLPASISWIDDIHPGLFKLFEDCLHVNDRVKSLWSSFQTAVTLRTEATYVFVPVTTVPPCLLQHDDAGASGQAQMDTKLGNTHIICTQKGEGKKFTFLYYNQGELVHCNTLHFNQGYS